MSKDQITEIVFEAAVAAVQDGGGVSDRATAAATATAVTPSDARDT